jgi:hypothetical protein
MIPLNNGVGPCNGPAAKGGPEVCALVLYIPNPLARFLDDLRRELVPTCNPRAHVSILPPRPLSIDWKVASGQLRGLSGQWQPFDIELSGISVFPVTNVIYIELGEGAGQLREMHSDAARCLAFDEPFEYHPHVTLAQDFAGIEVQPLMERAQERWLGYRGSRRFRAEHAMFVQSTEPNCWIDLAEYSLGMAIAR